MFSVGFARGKLLLQRKWLKNIFKRSFLKFFFKFYNARRNIWPKNESPAWRCHICRGSRNVPGKNVKFWGKFSLIISGKPWEYLAPRHSAKWPSLQASLSVRWMFSVHMLNFNVLSIGIKNFIVLSGCMLYFVVLSVVAENVIMLIVAAPILRSCSWIQWGKMSCQFLPLGGSLGLGYVLQLSFMEKSQNANNLATTEAR